MTRRRPIRFVSRGDAVAQLRARLEAGGFPRLQMLLMVMLTGAAGFLASSGLLLLGLTQMGPRYGLACTLAYVCFLGLLRYWINQNRHQERHQDSALDNTDSAGFVDPFPSVNLPFGDGTASASCDAPPASMTDISSAEPRAASLSQTNTPTLPSGSTGFDLPDLDAEAIPILLGVLALGVLLSSLFVVWTAPALLAELLLDSLLAAGLYRRLRHIETRHWLSTALRKTVVPFLLTALLLIGVGVGLQAIAPDADSIGDVIAGP